MVTYVVLTTIMTIGAIALKADIKKFIIGFTVVFWISYICWIIGSRAPIAVTTAPDMKKFGISWSLRLTPEAGFIVALLVGLILGNFFPSFASAIKEAVRPEWYIKTAIVILGGFLGVTAAEKLGLASAVMFRGLCAIVEAYLIYWALVYFIARKYFKFSREWAAPLASGISICGVSAAIATGGAIKARPVVPIMVSSLVVIFAVVEFAGCDHGHSDQLLVAGGSGVATLGLPGSAGVPAGAVADTVVAPFNVVPEIDESVACVIVEPVAANMNLVLPAEGFLAGSRRGLRRRRGAARLRRSDHRLSPGPRPEGRSGLRGSPRTSYCFGKVIGGGCPSAPSGAGPTIMAVLAPGGPVYQAGTLSGNPFATAAGRAVLAHVTPADYEELTGRVARFAADLADALRAGGLSAVGPVAGPLAGLYVAAPGQPLALPRDNDQVGAIAGNGVYPRLFHALLRRGVLLAPGPYEVIFTGLAHGDQDLARAVEAAGQAAAEVATHLDRPGPEGPGGGGFVA